MSDSTDNPLLDPTPTLGSVLVEDESFATLIGGVVGAVVLVLICMILVLLWCLSRHKGSYDTNETNKNKDDDDVDDNDDKDEEESVGSDVALQTKEPLMSQEEQ